MNTSTEGQERKRIDSKTREALVIFYAAAQAIRLVAVKQLEQMCKRVPNGWRDLKMVSSRLDKLVSALLDTIPPKQLDTIVNQMQISHLKIATDEVGKKDGPVWVVPRDDLTEMVEAIVDNKCLMCDKSDWVHCNIRRIIQDMPVEIENVPNRCWRD